MSELITLTGGATETIHGTYAGSILYIAMLYGEAPDAWTVLTADNRKRTLAAAVRYFGTLTWSADYDTFAKRDLVAAFTTAQYELAVLIADDPSLVSAADQGSNLQSLSAGSAGLTFFNPSTKNAPILPPVLQRLLGSYLAAATLTGPDGGESLSSCSDNPFSACERNDRSEPY